MLRILSSRLLAVLAHHPHPPRLPRADTQGDISQARGQLGQLLFEFSQIELNRDLLEAIKRTESKTGAVGVLHEEFGAWGVRGVRATCNWCGGPPLLTPCCLPRPCCPPAGRQVGARAPAPGRLDRAAFELAVADAAELLQAQLGCVRVPPLGLPGQKMRLLAAFAPAAALLPLAAAQRPAASHACLPQPHHIPSLRRCSEVEAHSGDAGLRAAILRSYAVQAIATFADEGE